MKSMRFLLVIVLGISLGQLTGCSGGGDEPPLASTQADDYDQKISSIDGYQDFKFGMTYEEVKNSPMFKEKIYVMGAESDISFYSGNGYLSRGTEDKSLRLDQVSISVPYSSETLKGILETMADKYEPFSYPSSAELERFDNYMPRGEGLWDIFSCPKIYWYFANCQISVSVVKWRTTDYSSHENIYIYYKSSELASKDCDEVNAKSRSNSSSL